MAPQSSLVRSLTLLGTIVAVVGVAAMPLSYLTFAYQDARHSLQLETGFVAKLIEENVSARPEMWQYETVRLIETISRPTIEGRLEDRSVTNTAGQVLARTAFMAPSPVIAVSVPIYDYGRPAGSVGARRSIRRILVITGVFSLSAFLAGVFLVVIYRVYPMRMLEHALTSLAAEKERYKTTLQSLGEGIITVGAGRRVEFVNRVAERLTRWTNTEARGKPLDEIYVVVERPEDRLGADPQDVLISRNGEEIPIEVSYTTTIGESGRDAEAVIVFRDVAERRRAELELHAYRDHLEELVKARTDHLEAVVRELEAFSYSVSHDLRGPLRAIDGYSLIVMQEAGERLDPEHRRLLETVRSNSQRMGRIIDDLLRFARVGRHDMTLEQVDMNALAQHCYLELVSKERMDGITFIPGDLPPASADASLVRQIWVNLLGNALKYTAPVQAPVIEVGSTWCDGEEVYFVRDNGVGFPMEYAGRLFGVFQRLHSAKEFEGTGVGLALVQRIVLRHGGRVWAEGEPGKGATFSFTLAPKKVAPR